MNQGFVSAILDGVKYTSKYSFLERRAGNNADTMYDVRQEQYPAVIREMIQHEDNVTNHRIMWLLVGEGFIAKAFSLQGGRLH